jgi:hypothetical protein
MGFMAKLHSNNLESSMSALGQKQTFKRLRLMSALPPKPDIGVSREVLQIASSIFLVPVSFLPFSALFGRSRRRTYDPQLAVVALRPA